VNEAAADMIVEAADLSSEDVCLEIGPGLGVLTCRMVPRSRMTVAVEIDEKLSRILDERISSGRLRLVKSDILELDLDGLNERLGVDKFKVISNLPYRVTTPILFWLIENRRLITRAILTLQQEVADRLVARPSTKAYGSITVKLRYYATVRMLCTIDRQNFLPVPEVDSTLIGIDFLQEARPRVKSEVQLFRLIDSSFQNRRKMLRNCLKIGFGLTEQELDELESVSGVDLRRRGETLTLEEFSSIAEKLR
jgi:16S rRNA (adenine1518-N6/adenine1519-N6)-dimethyltransferase